MRTGWIVTSLAALGGFLGSELVPRGAEPTPAPTAVPDACIAQCDLEYRQGINLARNAYLSAVEACKLQYAVDLGDCSISFPFSPWRAAHCVEDASQRFRGCIDDAIETYRNVQKLLGQAHNACVQACP